MVKKKTIAMWTIKKKNGRLSRLNKIKQVFK